MVLSGFILVGAMLDLKTGKLTRAKTPYYADGASSCVVPPIKVRCMWQHAAQDDTLDANTIAEKVMIADPPFSLSYKQNLQSPSLRVGHLKNLNIRKRDFFSVARAASNINAAQVQSQHKGTINGEKRGGGVYRCPIYVALSPASVPITFIDMPCDDNLSVAYCVERQVAFILMK